MLMKKMKRVIPMILAMALVCTSIPLTAKADGSKVVTLGADLSEEQKTSMFEYFGASADEVQTITVTNADERQYLEGVASEAVIGTRAISCSYVEPTSDGGIQVTVANLTSVTSSMIASTLFTAGMENCNVVAAAPFEVSGTGALTGIMMAYETASGEALSEDQKETATEELITTGELADEIGQDEATDVINDLKEEVMEGDLTDEEIADAVTDALSEYNVSDDLASQVTALMEQISQYDYDVNALKETLDNLNGSSGGFFSRVASFFSNLFGGSSDEGILGDLNVDALGDAVVVNSTTGDSDSGESLWDRIVGFFRNLFSSDDEEEEEEEETEEEEEEDTEEEEPDEDENTDDEEDGGIQIYSEDTQTFSGEEEDDSSAASDATDEGTDDADASGEE